MAKHLLVVFSEAQPGREDEYNAWYQDQHLPDVLKVPGFRAAQRYRLQPAEGQDGAAARYLALYEVETNDIAAAMADLTARSGTPAMMISDALNMPKVELHIAEPFGQRVTAQPVEA